MRQPAAVPGRGRCAPNGGKAMILHVRVRKASKAGRGLRSLVPFSPFALLALFLGLAGCAHQQTRLQSEEEPETGPKYQVRTVGDVTDIDNANPIPISGVGLVVGLDGTGGNAPPGWARTMLEDNLKKRGVENVKEVLASPNTSLVLVSAMLPPGVRKDDTIDVEVTLPENSKTSSLRGGYLKECYLYNYGNKRELSEDYARRGGDNRYLIGHPVARAEGPLVVGFGDGDDAARLRQGRIWGGARSRINLPFYLALKPDQQFARVAQAVADRVNETFHGQFPGQQNQLATAKTRSVVFLNVPAHYRHNLPRYLRVVRLVPLEGGPNAPIEYQRQLAQDLLNPGRTVTAALRLEALGTASTPLLKEGLQSDHTLVRFTSAEALAYLGSPACGEELARLVDEQPALRAFCLTAMASLDEAICHVKLRELLASPSPEARYGAFRALRALDERNSAVQGELLNESFWLHKVAPGSGPLVHISSNRRAEIVLFGNEAQLQPPFSILTGEFTITANAGDDRATISRFSVQRGQARRQCSLQVEDVLRTLADMGGLYADAVEMLRQAHRCQGLTCRVEVDALPQATTVQELAKAGRTGTGIDLQTDEEIVKARADFGATPTLFARGGRQPSLKFLKEDATALRKGKEKDETRTVEGKNGKEKSER